MDFVEGCQIYMIRWTSVRFADLVALKEGDPERKINQRKMAPEEAPHEQAVQRSRWWASSILQVGPKIPHWQS